MTPDIGVVSVPSCGAESERLQGASRFLGLETLATDAATDMSADMQDSNVCAGIISRTALFTQSS